ncbi:hypothetical protein DP939_14080 [Spongiactinospora rosea]|uniref:Ricin B lectin domain-containing protein n=2 Tax=Spongiactinospora rosea TaxID=2248750 RepID=A0A366M319_9ACTN|nr:hypothetical protein DP939_14080 [Spongiactinospora rosea]
MPLMMLQLRGDAGSTTRVIANANSLYCPTPVSTGTIGSKLMQRSCDPDVPWGSWNFDGPYTYGGVTYYRLVNYANQMCMAVDAGTLNPGPHIIQWPCGTWADHYWRFVHVSGEIYRIINRNSGQCLAIDSGSTAWGAAVIQWPCGSWPDHFWRVWGGIPAA